MKPQAPVTRQSEDISCFLLQPPLVVNTREIMRVFITGATGFLGSHLVDRLLEKKWDIHLLVRRTSNLQWLLGKKVHYHFGDLTGDLKGLAEGLKEADICFHLAGVISAPRVETYYEVNTQGTANLLETALKVHPQIKRIVIVSSLAAHGPNLNDSLAREEDDCHPITDYGQSKRDAELVTWRYRDRLPVTIVRPPAIYGPRDRQVLRYFWIADKGFIPVPKGGGRVMNIAHVQDVVTGMLLVAEDPKAVGEIFFIGDSRDYEWGEVADFIALAVKKKAIRIKIPIPLAQWVGGVLGFLAVITGRSGSILRTSFANFLQKNWGLDIGKARRVLGYEPGHPLKRGMEETAAWYREEGWL